MACCLVCPAVSWVSYGWHLSRSARTWAGLRRHGQWYSLVNYCLWCGLVYNLNLLFVFCTWVAFESRYWNSCIGVCDGLHVFFVAIATACSAHLLALLLAEYGIEYYFTHCTSRFFYRPCGLRLRDPLPYIVK